MSNVNIYGLSKEEIDTLRKEVENGELDTIDKIWNCRTNEYEEIEKPFPSVGQGIRMRIGHRWVGGIVSKVTDLCVYMKAWGSGAELWSYKDRTDKYAPWSIKQETDNDIEIIVKLEDELQSLKTIITEIKREISTKCADYKV